MTNIYSNSFFLLKNKIKVPYPFQTWIVNLSYNQQEVLKLQ